MSYPVSHKTVVILDKSDNFLKTSCGQIFEIDVINKSREPSGVIPLLPISKTLWTCSVEAIAEYCRIVWDIFPAGDRLIRFVVCETDSALSVTDWNRDHQNLQHFMQAMAKCSSDPHVNSNQLESCEDSQIINGFRKAIETLSEPTHLQITYNNDMSNESLNGVLNRGRIVCISSFRNYHHIIAIEESVKKFIYQRNELIAKQKQIDNNCNLLRIDFCELVFINTYPIGDHSITSRLTEQPKHQISPLIASEVHSVKSGSFLAAKLSILVLSHYDLASTTVIGIPMKEEHNGSCSANYDVEIVHPSIAHTDLFKRGSFSAEEVCGHSSREGFCYDTITLNWCTPSPGTNAKELHKCRTAHRIALFDVKTRPSSCLANFLLSGRTVMLEIQLLNGSKVMSHMLCSHNGELYIHTLGTTGRLALEDQTSIREGCGGRVTDYRFNDFREMMRKNRLVPCRVTQTINKDTLFPIEKAKQSLTKQTQYWPLVSGHTIMYNIKTQIQSFLNLVPKQRLTQKEVHECKKSIYHLVEMERTGTKLPVPWIGIRGKGHKRDELYGMLWNEMERFLRSYCVTSEHKSILSCLLECRSKPDQHLTASVHNITVRNSSHKKRAISSTNQTIKATDWARNELSVKETNNTTVEPPAKKLKTDSIESVFDIFSYEFMVKPLEEKIKEMSDCDVVLGRLSKQDLDDYNIDYLRDKKYYELESEDEFDYNNNNNIYNKCNQNESCVRFKTLFNDDSTGEKSYNDNFAHNMKTRIHRKCRKRIIFTPEKPKKRKRLRDQGKRHLNRSSDGKFIKKSVMKSKKCNKTNLNDSHKQQEYVIINSNNNVINIIKNKKIGKNVIKSKKTATNNYKKAMSTSTPIKQTSVTGNNSLCDIFCDNLFNDSNTVNNSSENIDYKTFMGTRFRANDLLHKCNDCENGCEVDELSLTFHLLMTSPEDQLPNDLILKLNIDSDNIEKTDELNDSSINEINNNSNNELNIFPDISDIYQQTIEEESDENDLQLDPNLVLEIDNFFKYTTTQVSNNLSFFDPFLPSTSGYSLNSNVINTEQTLQDIEQELGVINTDINTNVIISPISNTSTQVTDNNDLNCSSTLTSNSQKMVRYECGHCLETFERNKLFRQHCSVVHPGLPKRCTVFSPTTSPIKESPLNVNESQNFSTSP